MHLRVSAGFLLNAKMAVFISITNGKTVQTFQCEELHPKFYVKYTCTSSFWTLTETLVVSDILEMWCCKRLHLLYQVRFHLLELRTVDVGLACNSMN